MLRASVVVGFIAIAASAAQAQPQIVDPETPPVRVSPLVAAPTTTPRSPSRATIRVDLGMGSPVGLVGVVYTRRFGERYAIEAGAGLGVSGVVLSAMPKLHIGSGRTRFTPGMGLSVGIPLGGVGALHTGHPADDSEAPGDPVTMPWIDLDLLGVEHRGETGFVLAASAGLTFPLRRAHWDAFDLGDDIEPFDIFPQLRIGLGYEL